MVAEGKTYCGWCSRFRRGILYKFAKQNGYTKIALGHHRDDMIGTLFLNLFHGGKLKTMPAKLLSDDGQNMVIRPLAYCREKDIERYAELKALPIIPCNLCAGRRTTCSARLSRICLQEWDTLHPGRLASIYRAMTDVVPSHLADRGLFDFSGLEEKQRKQIKPLDVVNL